MDPGEAVVASGIWKHLPVDLNPALCDVAVAVLDGCFPGTPVALPAQDDTRSAVTVDGLDDPLALLVEEGLTEICWRCGGWGVGWCGCGGGEGVGWCWAGSCTLLTTSRTPFPATRSFLRTLALPKVTAPAALRVTSTSSPESV